MKKTTQKTSAKYYDIRTDLESYPDCWCYLIWSKRGPGKTYSTLRYVTEEGKRYVFMKRTIDDVNLLCTRMEGIDGVQKVDDISPFQPLNRDFGFGIYPFSINKKGLAGFWHGTYDSEGKLQPYGNVLGWIVACSAVTKFKGFSMDADFIIFDEFIPKPWERVSRTEGDSILDLYETVNRDRIKRGKPEIKLICLANATSINNPMFNSLAVIDDVAEMDITNTEYKYLEDRGILLHCINSEFDIEEGQGKTGIQKAMDGTPWAQMAYGGHFGYNDFSNIGRISLKGYKPVCTLSYKLETFYIYIKEGNYYMTKSRHNSERIYNLNRENDQKLFYSDFDIDLRLACVEGKFIFETYSMYDLIVNYKKIFSL